MNRTNIKRLMAIIGLSAFLMVGVFGLLLSIGTNIHIDAVKCSMQSQNNQCVNVLDHINTWESAFTVVLSATAVLLALVWIIFSTIASNSLRYNNFHSMLFSYRFRYRPRSYVLTSLAQGTLQPTL